MTLILFFLDIHTASKQGRQGHLPTLWLHPSFVSQVQLEDAQTVGQPVVLLKRLQVCCGLIQGGDDSAPSEGEFVRIHHCGRPGSLLDLRPPLEDLTVQFQGQGT